MNKFMTVGCAALMVAGVAGAQVGMPAGGSEPEITAQVDIDSSYVWRGLVYNNDMVVQPQITIEHYGVSFNIWGNYNLGSDMSGVSGDFSEIDYTLGYKLPVNWEDLEISVGMIHYTFPNVTVNDAAAEATTELYLSGTLTTFADMVVPVIPSITLYGDIDEARGTYVEFAVEVPYELSDVLSASFNVSAGYGNTAFNDFYFDPDQNTSGIDAKWDDFSAGVQLAYAVSDDLTASVQLQASMFEGGAVRDGASDTYESQSKIWGGVGIAYDF